VPDPWGALVKVRQLSNTQLQLTRQRRRARSNADVAAQLNCISLDLSRDCLRSPRPDTKLDL